MFFEIPQNLILMVAGAFLLGWLLASIKSSVGSKFKARERDPRDTRIRSLEADLRVAQTDLESAREKTTDLETELEEVNDGIEKRDNVISHQQERLDETSANLKGSVIKTRELRSELSARATENIKSEAKLRDVATELEVAHASTDMIATGVLDYALAPEAAESDDDEDLLDESDMSGATT
jgi:predicted RNase H-like nuclease (RuvC/YqgF family)